MSTEIVAAVVEVPQSGLVIVEQAVTQQSGSQTVVMETVEVIVVDELHNNASTSAPSELYITSKDNMDPIATDVIVGTPPPNTTTRTLSNSAANRNSATFRDRATTVDGKGDIGHVPNPALQAIRGDESEVRASGKSKRKERRLVKRSTRIKIVHKKNLLGETIFKGHPSWVLMQDIQTGIRNGVGKNRGASTTFPAMADFAKSSEFFNSPPALKFPTEGSSQTIPHTTGPFKFKDYCPNAFRSLRLHFGIDPADYMVSLCNTQKDGENALRELPTPGKSGSLFLFSSDMRFILKTVPKREAKLLRYILPAYYEHVLANENTLLPRFFGLHRVKPHKGRQVRFVVMGNVFPTTKKIHERYDLKGSTVGRAALPAELMSETVTLKDLDFKDRKGSIALGAARKTTFLQQLASDCKLLQKLGIMDYSLLIGVHYENRKDDLPSPDMGRNESLSDGEEGEYDGSLSPSMTPLDMTGSNVLVGQDPKMSIFQQNDGGMEALDDAGHQLGERYYLGVIDILMLYSARKRLEHTLKSIRYDADSISSVSPDEYATRFQQFITNIIT